MRGSSLKADVIIAGIGEVQIVLGQVQQVVEAVDPALELPADTVVIIVNLAAEALKKAIQLWQNASGVAITPESIQALLLDPTMLSASDAG